MNRCTLDRAPLARHIGAAMRRAERVERGVPVYRDRAQFVPLSSQMSVSEVLTLIATALVAACIVFGGLFAWSVTP